MTRNIISIDDRGSVSVPNGKIQMRDFEIAELFGIMIPTIRSNIRAILKTGVAMADLTGGATLVGCNILPDYHGLDVVVAVAFRIQSYKAELFSKWIMCKMIRSNIQPI